MVRTFMKKRFDTPLAFTLNGVLVKKAEKGDMKGIVYLREEVSRYLEAQIEGGNRDAKGLEVGLRARRLFSRGGSNIPPSVYFVPSTAFRSGKGGNITKSRARKILDGTKKRGGRFFLFQDDSDGKFYVYEKLRGGEDIRVALIGIDKPRYSRRLDFYGIIQRTVAANYEKAFKRAMDKALPPSDY